MRDLIDRKHFDKALEDVLVVASGKLALAKGPKLVNELTLDYISKVREWLAEEPAVDAVEVVRCKDCDHCIVNESHPDKPLICTMTLMCGTTKPDNFCWQGTPKAEHREPEIPSLKERIQDKRAICFESGGKFALMDQYGISIFDKSALIEDK